MRVFIGVGHGGPDPGAVGRVKEADANRTIALELKRLLESYGITVGISRTGDEEDRLADEIAEANAFAPDLAVEVHSNAGGGDGFEVYVQTNRYAAQSSALAKAIEAEVKAIGQHMKPQQMSKVCPGKKQFNDRIVLKREQIAVMHHCFVNRTTHNC